MPNPFLLLGLGVAGAVTLIFRRLDSGTQVMTTIPAPPGGNSRLVSDLHPEFEPKVRRWQREMQRAGIPHKITFTYRTLEKQAELLAAGNTQVSFGYHNVGLAFDYNVLLGPERRMIFPNPDDGTPIGTLREWADLMTRAAEIGKSQGMIWGGDWSQSWVGRRLGRHFGWDPYHLEWHPGINLQQTKARQENEGFGFRVV